MIGKEDCLEDAVLIVTQKIVSKLFSAWEANCFSDLAIQIFFFPLNNCYATLFLLQSLYK